MSERIDAHQHYWIVTRGDYGWMGPEVEPIRHDYLPADLKPHRDAAGISRTVVVQAAPTVAETEFLLDLAQDEPTIAAVVGWVDLKAPDAVRTLERLAKDVKFRGIRPMLQDIEDTFDILDPACMDVLEKLPALGLTFDALIQPRHLPVIAALADRLPYLPIVVDHGAKPFIAAGIFEPWAEDIAALARRGNVFCKLSGLVTEAGDEWSLTRLRPYADHLIAAFGAPRLMFGSDWPVVELAAPYERWWAAANELAASLGSDGRDALFGATAAGFYRL
jgi:L-fuconolactonase